MKFRARVAGSSARRGFWSLFLGTSFGNGLALLLSPVITRIFDPASFGAFTLLTAVAMILTPLVSLRLELAVPLPPTRSASYAIVHAGLTIATVMSAALALLLYLVGPTVGASLRLDDAGPLLWTAPVMAYSMATFTVLNALAIRSARYTAIARRNIVMSVSTLGTQIAFGLLGFGLTGLLLGFLLGQVVGAASLLFGSGLRDQDAAQGRDLALVRATLARYKHVPRLLGIAGVLNVLGLQVPIIIFSFSYGSEVVGWLGLTQRILVAPVALIGLSIGQVYLSELARSRREGNGREREYFWRATRVLLALGSLIAVTLLLAGPALFGIVFGSEWQASGDYARALSFALAAQLVVNPLGQTLVVLERFKVQLAWDTTRLIVVAGSMVGAVQLGWMPLSTVWTLSLGLSATYLLLWVLSYRTLISAPPLEARGLKGVPPTGGLAAGALGEAAGRSTTPHPDPD
jgi:O-antigen/teichoic acid export membrane protein